MNCRRRYMHGKRRRRSPLHQNEITHHVTDPTVKRESDKYATVRSNNPKFIGGSAPNPAKSAISIGKYIYKGVKKLMK